MFRYLISFAFIALTFTLLYLYFLIFMTQNIKTRYSNLFGAMEDLWDNYTTGPGYPHTLDLALYPLPTDEESLLCQGTQLCPDQLTGGLNDRPLPQPAPQTVRPT